MADLITLARAKSNLDNLATTSAEETTLAQLISAVSAAIENHTRRVFAETEYDQLYSGTSTPVLRLNHYPIVDVDSITVDPFGSAVTLTDYDVDADAGLLRRDRFGEVWSGGVNHYRVIYTAGYATIPADIQEACAEWVAQLFWKTKSDPGVGPGHPPIGVARMLEPWRRFRL